MRDMQTKFLEILTDAVEAKKGLEVVHNAAFANVGTVYVQPKDGFTALAVLSYQFERHYANFTLNDTCNYHVEFDGVPKGGAMLVTLWHVINAVIFTALGRRNDD